MRFMCSQYEAAFTYHTCTLYSTELTVEILPVESVVEGNDVEVFVLATSNTLTNEVSQEFTVTLRSTEMTAG